VAAALAISGDPIDAAQALEWGIVSQVVEPHDLDQRVETLAREIAARDTQALSCAKQSILRGLDRPLEIAIAHDAGVARLARAEAHAEADTA
jgi:enoyl-CoA hydratase